MTSHTDRVVTELAPVETGTARLKSRTFAGVGHT